MKTYKYLMIIFVALLNMACDSLLELEPEQSVREDVALSTEQNVRAVLIGAYDELGVSNIWGGETQRNSELLGSNGEVLWAGTFQEP
ncbi:MAG: RagB/SusD family nutrient uptake outer membrane protein, partial [Bacteroidota bacterium]